MRKIFLKSAIIFSLFLLNGCEYTGVEKSVSSRSENLNELGVYSGFSPVEINILPLTKINIGNKNSEVICVYISMADRFGSQIKAPAIFRFELYEKISRSGEVKGRRVFIWPDIDLQNPGDNNCHWEDFLRAYKFDLACDVQKNRHYVFQVTCLCPSGRRLASEITLSAQ